MYELPIADDCFFGVPAHRIGLIVCPDAKRIAVGIGISVAMRENDVADLETRDVHPNLDDFSDRRVTGIDLAATGVRNIHGVREGGMGDVVFGRDHEDANLYIARLHVADVELIQNDDARDVDAIEIVVDPRSLGGDGFCSDGVGAGHRNLLGSRRRPGKRAERARG